LSGENHAVALSKSPLPMLGLKPWSINP